MLFEDLFFRLPVRDTYRETKHNAVFLRAHPTVARICFVIEVVVSVVIFGYSYHITANTSTTDTKISYEALPSPYVCEVLSPRSNSEAFSLKTSDAVFFSKARWNLDTCQAALDTTGLDVCSDDVREDYVLNVVGMSSDNSNCIDVILSDGYRFCFGSSSVAAVQYDDHRTAFPKRNTPEISDTGYFYFTKGEGDIIPISAAFDPRTTSSLLTDYVSDLNNNVYVLAEDQESNSRPTLFQFSPTSSTAKKLYSPAGTAFSGIAYGNQALFMYELTSQLGKIYSYNVTSKAEATISVSCADFGQVSTTGGSDVRYLSYGSDNNLYAMCSGLTSVEKQLPGNPPSSYTYKQFDFFRVNPQTATSTRFGANIKNMNFTIGGVENEQGIDEIAQVYFSRGNFYFTTVRHNNVLRGDVSKSSVVSGVQVIRSDGLSFQTLNDGDYLLPGRNQNIYFAAGTFRYFDTTTKTLATYTDLGTLSYYATAVEVGFSYQLCDGQVSNYTIDYETSGSFFSACQKQNGLYFQSNTFLDVPESCRGTINASTHAAELLSCEGVAALRNQYLDSTCPASISKVCTAEFTDNPPFSCSKDSYPSFITTIATAFANSSGVWTFVVIFLKLCLKCYYPHGYYDYDYDEERERFIPRGFKVDYPESIKGAFTGYHRDHGTMIHPEHDTAQEKQEEEDRLRQRNLSHGEAV